MITLSCPGCQKEYTVDDSRAGKRAECTSCKFLITVPDGDDDREPPQDAPERAPRRRGRTSGLTIALLVVWAVAGVGSCATGGLFMLSLTVAQSAVQGAAWAATAAAVIVGLYVVARSIQMIFTTVEKMAGKSKQTSAD